MAKFYEYDLDINGPIAPARLVRMVGHGKRVLEVGCSTGSSTRALRDAFGCEVVGLEIDADAAELARKYCAQVVVGNIEQLDLAQALGERQFDAITFGDVLEHLRSPLDALIKVKPFLAPDGVVIVSVPNITHFSVAFELLNGRFDYREKGLLDDTHIRFFTAKSLLKTLEKAGLRPVEIERVVVEPEETELGTVMCGQEHKLLLEYAGLNNPEYLTYQFVVKASASEPAVPEATSTAIEANEKIAQLQVMLEKSRREVRVLQSRLDWVDQGLPTRLYRRFSGLFGRAGRS